MGIFKKRHVTAQGTTTRCARCGTSLTLRNHARGQAWCQKCIDAARKK